MNRNFVACAASVVLIGCGMVQEFGAPSEPAPTKPEENAPPATLPGDAPGDQGTPTLSWMNPTPTGNDLRGIWGTADDDVWIVGSHGTIVRWDPQAHKASVAYEGKTDQDLYAVWGSSKDDVWIGGSVGGDGQLLHWDGKAWSSSFTLGKHPIHSLWGTSSNDVWALGEAGQTFQFDGNTFKSRPICNFCDDNTPPPLLRDLWGASSNDVWAVGEDGDIFHYDGLEGGWKQATKSAPGLADPFAAGNAYRGVWGSSANDVWAVYVAAGPGKSSRTVGFSHWDGSAWRVAQVEEGGVYEESTLPTGRGHRVWGRDANDVFAIVDSSTWRWNGTSWKSSLAGTPSGNAWQAVWASKTSGIMAVGPHAAFATLDSNQSWKEVIPAMRADLSSVSVAPDHSVVAITEGLGNSWYGLVRWTSTGWTALPELPIPNLHTAVLANVKALSKNDVWIAGTGRDGDGSSPNQNYAFVAHLTNNTSWSIDRIPTMKIAIGLHVRSASDAWVAGDRAVARYNGKSWSNVPLPTSASDVSAYGVTGTAENDAWIVGTSSKDGAGVVLHWDGSALSEAHRSMLVAGEGIWASSAKDVWVSGQPGVRFDGTTWSAIEKTDFRTSALWGSGPNDVWLLSNSSGEGNIRHWDGTNITTVRNVSPGLNGVSGSGGKDVWIVGSGGASLRYAASPWAEPR